MRQLFKPAELQQRSTSYVAGDGARTMRGIKRVAGVTVGAAQHEPYLAWRERLKIVSYTVRVN